MSRWDTRLVCLALFASAYLVWFLVSPDFFDAQHGHPDYLRKLFLICVGIWFATTLVAASTVRWGRSQLQEFKADTLEAAGDTLADLKAISIWDEPAAWTQAPVRG